MPLLARASLKRLVIRTVSAHIVIMVKIVRGAHAVITA